MIHSVIISVREIDGIVTRKFWYPAETVPALVEGFPFSP